MRYTQGWLPVYSVLVHGLHNVNTTIDYNANDTNI